MISESITNTVLKKVLDLKENEKFLIVTDTIKEEMAKPFFENAKYIASDSKMIVMEPSSRHGEEPPKNIYDNMEDCDVAILLTSKSLSHTKARRNANNKGARLISCPGLTYDMLNRCVDINYDELIEFHKKLRPYVVNSNEIRITSKLGTDVSMSVINTSGKYEEILKNIPGSWGNLPDGEVDSGVINCNGKLIIDGAMAGIGMLENMITLDIKDNYAKIISKNEDSYKLKSMLDEVGPDAYKIAELGIGTNPAAKIIGNILEDEKVKGTIHMAVGNDMSYGGTNNVPVHLDGIVKDPTIYVDGKMIMEDGKFLI